MTDLMYPEYDITLTVEEALRIKKGRISGWTYRTLSIEITGTEDQVHGAALCEAAALKLGEDPSHESWDKE